MATKLKCDKSNPWVNNMPFCLHYLCGGQRNASSLGKECTALGCGRYLPQLPEVGLQQAGMRPHRSRSGAGRYPARTTATA